MGIPTHEVSNMWNLGDGEKIEDLNGKEVVGPMTAIRINRYDGFSDRVMAQMPDGSLLEFDSALFPEDQEIPPAQ